MPDDFLVSLGTVVALTEAAVLPTASAGVGDSSISLYLQIVDACAEATVAVAFSRESLAWVVQYLLLALDVIEALEYLNGYGSPDQGADFKDSSAEFSHEISSILASAAPSLDQWSGGIAAQQYQKLNATLQGLAGAMALADEGVVQALTEQGGMVEDGRMALAACRGALTGAIVYAQLCLATYQQLRASGRYASAEALKTSCTRWGYATASVIVTAACVPLGDLIWVGTQAAKGLGKIRRDGYKQIFNGANAITAMIPPPAPAVAVPEVSGSSTVPDLFAIPDAGSRVTAGAPVAAAVGVEQPHELPLAQRMGFG